MLESYYGALYGRQETGQRITNPLNRENSFYVLICLKEHSGLEKTALGRNTDLSKLFCQCADLICDRKQLTQHSKVNQGDVSVSFSVLR